MKIVVLSDLHINGSVEWKPITDEMIRRIKNTLGQDEKVVFFILGDIINGDPNHVKVLENYRLADDFIDYISRSFDDYDIKFYFVPGNHDLDNGTLDSFNDFVKRHSLIEGSEYKFDSKDNSVYSFVMEGFKFILVDSTLSRDYSSHGTINGKLLKQQNDHDSKEKSIVFMHHPPFSVPTFSGDDKSGEDKALANPLDIMYLHSEIVFYGHQHGNPIKLQKQIENTLYVSVSGFKKETLKGKTLEEKNDLLRNDFALLDIKDERIIGLFRYSYDGSKFVKSVIIPQKNEAKSEQLSIPMRDFSKELINIRSRSYYMTDNRKENYRLTDLLTYSNHIVITGEAGIGKTIATKMLYMMYLENDEYFPILIDLRWITAEDANRYISFARSNRINNKDALIIIDGVSESTAHLFRTVFAQLITLSQEDIYVKIVITKRDNYSFIHFDDSFIQFHIKEFCCDDVNSLLEINGITEIDNFWEQVYVSGYDSILGIPFIAKQVVDVYKNNQHLPAFRSLINTIIHNSLVAADQGVNNDYRIIPNEARVIQSFSEFGFLMQVINQHPLPNHLYTQLFKDDNDLQTMQDYTGILCFDDLYNKDFIHDIFFEWFVSEYLHKLQLDELLEVVSYESNNEKHIKRLWYDIVLRIISIRKENDLLQWIIQNDNEFLLLNPLEKSISIHLDKEKIVQSVLMKSFDQNLPIHLLISASDIQRFIEIYSSPSVWHMITDELAKPHNEYGLSTLLQLIQYASKDYDKTSIQMRIIELLKQNQKEYIKCFALKALRNINPDSNEYVNELIRIFDQETDSGIIRHLFEIISACSNPDKFFDYAVRMFETKDCHNIDIAFELRFDDVIKSLKNLDTILYAAKYMCENDCYRQKYNSHKQFEASIDRVTQIYDDTEENKRDTIFNTIYECFLIASDELDGRKVKKCKTFFLHISRQKEVLERILADKTSGLKYLALENIMDSNLLAVFIDYYRQELITDEVYKWYANRYSVTVHDRTLLSDAYREISRKELALNEKPEWEINREKGEKEYFVSLFNRALLESKINELIKIIGEDICICTFVDEHLSSIPNDRQDLRMIGSVIWRYTGRSEKPLSSFLSSYDWDYFQIYAIVEFIDAHENFNNHCLTESQLVILIGLVDAFLQSTNLEEIEFTASISPIIKLTVIAITKLDYKCDNEKLLEMLMFPWFVFSSSTSSNESATLDFVSYYVEDKKKLEDRIKYNISNKELTDYAKETHIIYCLENNLNNAVSIAVDLFKSTQESLVYRKPVAIKYLIRQNGEQYVDNLISPETEDTILEYLTEFLTNDNHCLIDELIQRNNRSADGLLFLRNLITLNRKEGIIKYVEYVNEHHCVPEHEDSSVDITMQIRKIEDISLLDQIIILLKIAHDPNFLDKTERGLKAALDSVLYKMCKKSPHEMFLRLKSIELNGANDQLKTKYNYYISILNDELKIACDIPWTFDQAITYIEYKRKR